MRFYHATRAGGFGTLCRMQQEDVYLNWVRSGLDKDGKTQTGLATAIGVKQPQISRMLAGDRKIKLTEIPRIAAYLGVPPPERAQFTVPLVGYVGAGAAAHFFAEAQGPFADVTAPEGSTEDTVGVEIQGDSLGAFFDRWIVFYDDVRRPVTNDLIGKLCVVGLSDDRVLIKKLIKSNDKKRFHLISLTEEPILDVIVDWAARVKTMVPR